MAGKHVGSANYLSDLSHTNPSPFRKENRAYADGAEGLAQPGDVTGNIAHALGAANAGEETAATGYSMTEFTANGGNLPVTAAADSSPTQLLISFWFKVNVDAATPKFILQLDDGADRVVSLQWRDATADSRSPRSQIFDAGESANMTMTATGDANDDSSWWHYLATFDTTGGGVGRAYLSERGTANDTQTNATTGPIGTPPLATVDGGQFFESDLDGAQFGDFYIGPFQDITVEANRRKFISSDGQPVNPTGESPFILFGGALTLAQLNAGTNLGAWDMFGAATGGDFT